MIKWSTQSDREKQAASSSRLVCRSGDWTEDWARRHQLQFEHQEKSLKSVWPKKDHGRSNFLEISEIKVFDQKSKNVSLPLNETGEQ